MLTTWIANKLGISAIIRPVCLILAYTLGQLDPFLDLFISINCICLYLDMAVDRYSKMVAESDICKGKLLSEENKDLDQQRRLEVQEKERKEIFANYSKLQKENQDEIESLNKKVSIFAALKDS